MKYLKDILTTLHFTLSMMESYWVVLNMVPMLSEKIGIGLFFMKLNFGMWRCSNKTSEEYIIIVQARDHCDLNTVTAQKGEK